MKGRIPLKLSVSKQLENIEKQEQIFFHKSEQSLMKSTLLPIFDKIQNKIPNKLVSTLDTAFYKGFQLVFEKGSPLIEKTYNKDKIEMDFDINHYAVNKEFSKRHIKRLDKHSRESGLINSSFSAIEGSVLGLLGIGLPDIPLFLSVIVKTIYEIALSYGYQYDKEEEQVYILLLISTAVSSGEKQREYNLLLEQLGNQIDNNISIAVKPDPYMKKTAKVLSDVLLTTKFIQGIPIIGAVGGAVNYSVLNKISIYARLKYKKRYLLKKLAR